MADTPHINDLVRTRLSRRGILGGMAAIPFLSVAACATAPGDRIGATTGSPYRTATFTSVPTNRTDDVTVPEGYVCAPLISWGEPLFDTVSGPADLDRLDRAQQEQRFGTHNDMLALFPATWSFPADATATRQILCSNHEYFDPAMAFPGNRAVTDYTKAQVETLFAAMGVGVVAIEKQASGEWRTLRDARPGSGINRRITPFTPVAFTGPAADHPWITAASEGFNAQERGVPEGTVACGTLANCAGGQTPWGTYLTSEENFQSYFRVAGTPGGALAAAQADPRSIGDAASFGYRLGDPRPGLPAPASYDLATNPTGPAVYGWVVEIDPYDPTSIPKKRTAIGRKKGENAATALARDGRVAVYQGDDQLDEFTYKFVTDGRFAPADRRANMDLLDQGVLHVARLEADGTGRWLAMTLEAANAAVAGTDIPAFTDLGDVMVRARIAARAMGATPMDRPEDVEAIRDDRWIGTGTVLIPCTKGTVAAAGGPGKPDRPGSVDASGNQLNLPGHVVRLEETGGDCGATTFAWDIFLMGGDPEATTDLGQTPSGKAFHQSVVAHDRATFTGAQVACPDNLCFDSGRNVWITTDGMGGVFPCNDVVLVAGTEPGGTPQVRRFMVGPIGAEITGPAFAPDERTFFASIQHPGGTDLQGNDFSDQRWAAPGTRPASAFPGGAGTWPRSAVIQVRRVDGGVVGT